MKKVLILCLTSILIQMIISDRLNKAELIRFGDSKERRRVKFRPTHGIYYSPILNLPFYDNSVQKDVDLFKSLKQFINHTKKKLDPKENWSRLDDDYDENSKRIENSNVASNFQNLRTRKKRKNKKKKCNCECPDKDLIITVPRYKYKDIPLGKEVSSNHLQANQYESSPLDTHPRFESMQNEDYEPNESTQIHQTKFKENYANGNSGYQNGLDRIDNDLRSLIKNKLPDKNLNYIAKQTKKNGQIKSMKSKKQIKNKVKSNEEEVESTNEEPIDFIQNDQKEFYYDVNKDEYHQYIDIESDDVEDYDSDIEEQDIENITVDNYDESK